MKIQLRISGLSHCSGCIPNKLCFSIIPKTHTHKNKVADRGLSRYSGVTKQTVFYHCCLHERFGRWFWTNFYEKIALIVTQKVCNMDFNSDSDDSGCADIVTLRNQHNESVEDIFFNEENHVYLDSSISEDSCFVEEEVEEEDEEEEEDDKEEEEEEEEERHQDEKEDNKMPSLEGNP